MVLNMDRVDIASLGMFGISSPGCLARCPLSMRAYFVEAESPIGILSRPVYPPTFKKIINISICLHRSHCSHVPGFSFVGDKKQKKKKSSRMAIPTVCMLHWLLERSAMKMFCAGAQAAKQCPPTRGNARRCVAGEES